MVILTDLSSGSAYEVSLIPFASTSPEAETRGRDTILIKRCLWTIGGKLGI